VKKCGDVVTVYRIVSGLWIGPGVRRKAGVLREWRWRRVAPNGEIVGASTEGYKRKVDCLANAKRAMTPCEIKP
jgi:hypothetical protein